MGEPPYKGNRSKSPSSVRADTPTNPLARKGLALEVLAANPGDQDPEGADQGHNQGWEVEDLIYEDADRRGARHQAAQ